MLLTEFFDPIEWAHNQKSKTEEEVLDPMIPVEPKEDN